MDTLTRQLEEGSDESILQLPSALLEEKNLEIDHLNQQILQLQQELDMTNDNKVSVSNSQTNVFYSSDLFGESKTQIGQNCY